jgi:hypothetical protein
VIRHDNVENKETRASPHHTVAEPACLAAAVKDTGRPSASASAARCETAVAREAAGRTGGGASCSVVGAIPSFEFCSRATEALVTPRKRPQAKPRQHYITIVMDVKQRNGHQAGRAKSPARKQAVSNDIGPHPNPSHASDQAKGRESTKPPWLHPPSHSLGS